MKKSGTSVKSAKIGGLYGQLVAAWRAGALADFYYGTRADNDATIVWKIGETEFAKTDHVGVQAAIDAALTAAGIVALAVGAACCGYRSLTVDYDDGTTMTETYNGVNVVKVTTGAVAVLATAA